MPSSRQAWINATTSSVNTDVLRSGTLRSHGTSTAFAVFSHRIP
ncbi:MAG: hypothetical protein PHV03_09175 [Desulfitobacteriaceae bacterium]|nr:hypothetical protein [Desulfitobacteriaceae bacterium]